MLSFAFLLLGGAATSYGETYSFDGSGNNVAHPDWGKSFEIFPRLWPQVFPPGSNDGQDKNVVFVPPDRPNCCDLVPEFSPGGTDSLDLNTIGVADEPANPESRTLMATYFGQIVVHDMSLSLNNATNRLFGLTPCFPPIQRHEIVDATPERTFTNVITSWFDLSTVYGSEQERADNLRVGQNGQLLIFENGQDLPQQCNALGVAMEPENPIAAGFQRELFFCAGDPRANENPALLMLHVMLVREHNRLARRLQRENPSWNDEQLFHKARVLNIAQYQNIMFYEWLPKVLGPEWFVDNMEAYPGYDANTDGRITAEMAAFGNRFLHGTINDQLLHIPPEGGPETNFAIRLEEVFFKAGLHSWGVEGWINGLNSVPCRSVSLNWATSIAATPPFLQVQDCVRGRDFGLPDFQTMQGLLGFTPLTGPNDLTSTLNEIQSFVRLYGELSNFTYDNVDPVVGGAMQDAVPEGLISPTVRKLIQDQWLKTRNGDRFWFENPSYTELTNEEKAIARTTKLSDIMMRNSRLDCTPTEQFLMPLRSPSACVEDVISSLILYDTNRNHQVRTLFGGEPGLRGFTDTIDLNLDGPSLTLVAKPGPFAMELVGKVQFFVNGGLVRTENVAPYALAGDTNFNLNPFAFSGGIMEIKVQAFDKSNKKLGGPVKFFFDVIA